MKELIYLDKDFLHSFIAQTNDGLIISKSTELQEQRTETHQESTGAQARGFLEIQGDTGKFEVPLLLKSPSAKATMRISPGQNHSESFSIADLEAGKEIISTQLHDNALNKFESYLNEHGLVNIIDNDSPNSLLNPGVYIKTTSNFTAFNFEVLEKMLGDEFFEIIKYSMIEKKTRSINEIENNDNIQPTKKKSAIKLINKQFETLEKEQFSPINNVKTMLKYINSTVPAKAFIKMDKFFVPLKEEFLRESINELIFKYGQNNPSIKITLIGKITKQLSHKETDIPNFSDLLNGSPQTVLQNFLSFPTGLLALLEVFKANDFIVSPVAIYFE
ncbi:DUF6414 family protein [Bacillus wiedmannii]|uniref:DUF6414 family protein n=1 Tax=Bacillus wiedmannii TaxID=1890302 RepID=UPI000BFB2D40|nr:hypothetical protein [Bacillus wiedmannii]PHG46051.1 hypothetical protein COI54_17080 [Bacillus wiedmannii]